MGVHSKLVSGERRTLSLLTYVAQLYLSQLNSSPVLTKAITSALVSGLGDLIAQEIDNIRCERDRKIYSFQRVAACAGFGLLTGPLYHQWYRWLEALVPADARLSAVKRLLLDRLLFTPALILLYLHLVPTLEGKSQNEIRSNLKANFTKTLVFSWRFWSFLQYFILNYIPEQYRVLSGNFVSLIFSVLLSLKRSTARDNDGRHIK